MGARWSLPLADRVLPWAVAGAGQRGVDRVRRRVIKVIAARVRWAFGMLG